MKHFSLRNKYFLLFLFVFAFTSTFSQSNTFPSSGNVGIGTTNPQFNIEISSQVPYLKLSSSIYTTDPSVLTVKGGIIFNQENSDKTAAILEAVPPGYHVPGILFSTKTAWNVPGPGSTDWFHRMFIHPNGNVGIGTTTPDTKLAVNGIIHSKEVKVDLASWPDYVFKPDYDLPSLTEVKNYIDKNQHLPNMPSEQEVVKEGLKLGEINKLLTRKVEELTLYLIQQQKENDKLKEIQAKQFNAQQEQLIELKQQLSTIIKNLNKN